MRKLSRPIKGQSTRRQPHGLTRFLSFFLAFFCVECTRGEADGVIVGLDDRRGTPLFLLAAVLALLALLLEIRLLGGRCGVGVRTAFLLALYLGRSLLAAGALAILIGARGASLVCWRCTRRALWYFSLDFAARFW